MPTSQTGAKPGAEHSSPLVDRLGDWSDRWTNPPLDLIVDTSPAGGRVLAANQIASHVANELERGRSLYCIVRDDYVIERIGGPDGRALPPHCLTAVSR